MPTFNLVIRGVGLETDDGKPLKQDDLRVPVTADNPEQALIYLSRALSRLAQAEQPRLSRRPPPLPPRPAPGSPGHVPRPSKKP